MRTREVLLARKKALLEEYQRNQAKLSTALASKNSSGFSFETSLETITDLSRSEDFKWNPNGTGILSVGQGFLNLIDLKSTTATLQQIQLDGLIYVQFLSDHLLLCITEASIILFSGTGKEVASFPCLHFDKDTSVLGSYLLSDETICIVYTSEDWTESTALTLKKNKEVWCTDVLGTLAADHLFEYSPFYAKYNQNAWSIHEITTGTLENRFTMAGSYPVHFREGFLLAICKEELVLLSPSQIVKSLPIEPDWYAWTRSGRYLFVLHSQHISVIDLLSLEILSVLPHTLSDLSAAAKISSPSNNPRILLISNNGSNCFYRIKF